MERIGFIGLGTMGSAMAANLLKAGATVSVWNRTPGKAAKLVALGARAGSSPGDVAAASDITVVCVSDTPDVEAVLFGPGGIAESAAAGSLVIDCSTISPEATRGFGQRLGTRSVAMVDAPVSGGSDGARLATLTMFVGGADADVARAMPVLGAMGKTITHLGPLGSGQVAKAVNQVIIGGTYLAVAEGLVLGLRAGLDPAELVSALSGGSANSWVLTNRSGRMIEDEYPLGFRTSLHRKDLGIALGLADGVGLMLPLALLVATLEDRLIATGHADEDVSVIARAIRELATDAPDAADVVGGAADAAGDSSIANPPSAPV